jgi:D-sedoheptulose 7-phosphate isomerase
MTAPRDFGRELYPFLYPERATDGESVLLAAVRQSTLDKCADVIALRAEMIAEYGDTLAQAADAIAERFARGGKLLAFGNGGSATDADDAAADCLAPPLPAWRALPAMSLPADSATLSAVANDVGVASVFLRQIIALGDRRDVALGFSTSGNSPNVTAALGEAKRRGMLTLALAGYDGGDVARSGDVDYCFIARREFVPRIQEGHATLWHALLELVQHSLARQAERARRCVS